MTLENPLSLDDRVAIITGSGKETGIGAGIAVALARAGARVVINYVSDSTTVRAEKLRSHIESVAGPGRAAVVQADVSTQEGSRKIVEDTLQAFGACQIHILVNNAGYAVVEPILNSQPEDIMKTFQVGVLGPVLLLQAAYPYMAHGGRIINIGSASSRLGSARMPIYGAAKAAMDQLTFAISRELGRDGKAITVNTISPGLIMTDALASGPEAQPIKDYFLALTRAEDRLGTIEDIADAVLLLTSEQSRWITGQVISVSGGVTGG